MRLITTRKFWISVKRDGIYFWSVGTEGETLVIRSRRFPPRPKTYARTFAITPKAIAEGPSILAEAYDRALRNAQETDALLRQKGKRGLNFRTLRFYYVGPDDGTCDPFADGEPGTDHLNTLVSWKANAR